MADIVGNLMEDFVPVVKFAGIRTNKDMTFGDDATVTLPASTTIGGQSVVALGDITSSSTTATAFTVTNSGVFTGDAVVEFIANSLTTGVAFSIATNGQTSGTAMKITSTGTLVTTGNLLTLTADSATTAAGILRISANALTSGIGAVISSSATAITGAGRLLRVDHTGATGTSAVLSEFASAANDETVVLRVTASAALALGTLLDLSGASVTTGTILDMGGLDALTTGTVVNVASNSSSNGTRTLVNILNDHASATGTTPLFIQNDAVTGTGSKFVKILAGAQSTKTVTIWLSIDATTPNGALTGVAGDICLNGPSSVPFYCTGTTNWTALA